MQVCDVLVIGGGVAGLTAVLQAAKLGWRCVAFTGFEPPGGLLAGVESIQDIPDYPSGIAGYDLGPIMQEAAMDAGVVFLSERACLISRDTDGWVVHGEKTVVETRVVVLAMGMRLRSLNIPGETEFAGRGVSHCASCDAPLLRGHVAAVIGGGDAACQEALTIAKSATEVHLLVRGKSLRARRDWQLRVAQQTNIRLHLHTSVIAIRGDSAGVNAIEVQDGRRLEVRGVFAYAGLEPCTDIVRELVSFDQHGRILVDQDMQTSQSGLMAAGSLRSGSNGQASQGIEDGRRVALTLDRVLRNND